MFAIPFVNLPRPVFFSPFDWHWSATSMFWMLRCILPRCFAPEGLLVPLAADPRRVAIEPHVLQTPFFLGSGRQEERELVEVQRKPKPSKH